MNRALRKKLTAIFKKGEPALVKLLQSASLPEAFSVCHLYASVRLAGPLTEYERSRSSDLVSELGAVDWYHGGAGGLGVGDFLLPAGVTGADPRREKSVVSDRLDRVFFTQDLSFASEYQDQVPGGGLYRVEPIGVIETDPADLRMLLLIDRLVMPVFESADLHALIGKGFCASSAKIVEVLE